MYHNVMLASHQKYSLLYVNKWFTSHLHRVHNEYPEMRSYHIPIVTLTSVIVPSVIIVIIPISLTTSGIITKIPTTVKSYFYIYL